MSTGPDAPSLARNARRRVPVRRRFVTRLLVAIVLVLVVSFVVTIPVESNLSRDALAAQAEEVLGRQVRILIESQFRDRQLAAAEAGFARSEIGAAARASRQPTAQGEVDPERRRVAETLAQIRSRGRASFNSVGAYTRDPDDFVLQFGPRLEQPPLGLFEDVLAAREPRVVRTTDVRGPVGYAYVVMREAGQPPEELLLSVGWEYDRGYARTLRERLGGVRRRALRRGPRGRLELRGRRPRRVRAGARIPIGGALVHECHHGWRRGAVGEVRALREPG